MDATLFRAQVMGDWKHDPLFRQAVDLWHEYYDRCERFDRSVCTGPIRNGSILPGDARELGIIGRNARREMTRTARLAHEAGISPETWRSAQTEVLRRS
jgi:hypothetical protein